jgi:hypothetical protein
MDSARIAADIEGGLRVGNGEADVPITIRIGLGNNKERDLIARWLRGAAAAVDRQLLLQVLYARQAWSLRVEVPWGAYQSLGLATATIMTLEVPVPSPLRAVASGPRFALVLRRQIRVSPTAGLSVGLWLRLLPQHYYVGLIAPSGYVLDAPGGNVATCAQSVLSDPAGFVVGDVVALYAADGQRIGSGTQVVQSVVGTNVTLDGNFSGSLAANTVLEYAPAPATAPQADAVYLDQSPPYIFG